jgi:hypothetical protein
MGIHRWRKQRHGLDAGAGNLPHGGEVVQAEVEGCLEVLRAAIHLEISHIVLESDSANLLMALKSDDYNLRWEVGYSKKVVFYCIPISTILDICDFYH